jgi:hypothetical protein
MASATRHTHLEPVSPDNAVLLFVDQQEGLFSRVHEPAHTRSNLLALARSARLLGIPAVLTTALAAGPNGPQLTELTEPSRPGDHRPHADQRLAGRPGPRGGHPYWAQESAHRGHRP